MNEQSEGFEQLEDIIQSVVLNASNRLVDAVLREYPDDYNYIMNVKSDKPNQPEIFSKITVKFPLASWN